MKDLCQQYIAEVKDLFPIVGKQERKYLKKLSVNVEDYCTEETISTMDELYDNFGSPKDAVSTYFSTLDMPNLLGRIHTTQYVKKGIAFLVVIVFIGACVWGIESYHAQQVFSQEKMFEENTTIK